MNGNKCMHPISLQKWYQKSNSLAKNILLILQNLKMQYFICISSCIYFKINKFWKIDVWKQSKEYDINLLNVDIFVKIAMIQNAT